MRDEAPEYYNVVVESGAHSYRVAFHRGGHAMIVCRKTKHGETPLRLFGPTAQAAIEKARKVPR